MHFGYTVWLLRFVFTAHTHSHKSMTQTCFDILPEINRSELCSPPVLWAASALICYMTFL